MRFLEKGKRVVLQADAGKQQTDRSPPFYPTSTAMSTMASRPRPSL